MLAGLTVSLCAFMLYSVFGSSCARKDPAVESGVEHTGKLSDVELEEVRKYAEGFEFEDTKCTWPEPQIPPIGVQEALRRAYETGERRHLPYAALAVVRMQRKNIELYCTGTLLFVDPPTPGRGAYFAARPILAREFLRITKIEQKTEGGHNTRDFCEWISSNVSLFKDYDPLIEELDRLELDTRICCTRQRLIAIAHSIQYRIHDIKEPAPRSMDKLLRILPDEDPNHCCSAEDYVIDGVDVDGGQFTDLWSNPVRLVVDSPTMYRFISCGPNGRYEDGGGDDIEYCFNPGELPWARKLGEMPR